MTLDLLPPGTRAEIQKLTGAPDLVQRFYELGLCEGEEIEVVAVAPMGGPMEIRFGASRFSLRKSEAAGIHIANKV